MLHFQEGVEESADNLLQSSHGGRLPVWWRMNVVTMYKPKDVVLFAWQEIDTQPVALPNFGCRSHTPEVSFQGSAELRPAPFDD